jgi:hypothetical protein
MNKKTFVFGIIIFFTSIQIVYALSVNLTQGQITDIGIQEILTDFGMLVGTIKFRLGELSWPPEEIWLLPENTLPSQFKANSTYLEIPTNLIFSTCKTSVYYNQSLGYAFKILSSQILPNGTFCGLAYNGTYVILAKY